MDEQEKNLSRRRMVLLKHVNNSNEYTISYYLFILLFSLWNMCQRK